MHTAPSAQSPIEEGLETAAHLIELALMDVGRDDIERADRLLDALRALADARELGGRTLT